MDNKSVFAANLKKYMELNNKSRQEICKALGFNYYTFSDWVNGKKYPRMDKVEMLARYFGVLKSDLIEEKKSLDINEKNNDLAVKVVIRINNDELFAEVVSSLYKLDSDQLKGVNALLAFNE